MSELVKVFDDREVLNKRFQIFGTPDELLFLAKDVAYWIEYDLNSVSKLVDMVDETEKLTRTIFMSGQNRDMWFITEDGLYEILMQSRKPIAKEFKSEVKKILKTIRKTGQYSVQLPKTFAEALQLAADQAKKLEEAKPAMEFVERYVATDTTKSIREVAKILGIPERIFLHTSF